VLAVVTGITAVGVVLMAAMLITPAAAARYWTNNIRRMVWIAVAFGAFAGLAGAYISYAAPAMPTGPWMVVVSSASALLSLFCAPTKGIVPKMYTQYKNQRIIAEENALKRFYHLGERNSHFLGLRGVDELVNTQDVNAPIVKAALQRLAAKKFIVSEGLQWRLSEAGRLQAARVVRLHRLAELYLTKYMNIAADHVHDDAETIEHIDRKSTRLNSSHVKNSYAVFCLK